MALSFDQVRRFQVEDLALPLLTTLPGAGRAFFRRDKIIAALKETNPPRPATPEYGGITLPYAGDCVAHHPQEAAKLAAAFQRLEHDGLVVDWSGTEDRSRLTTEDVGEVFMVTALGQEVRDKGDNGAAFLRARRRLGIELHANLAPKLRTTVAVGAFEQATMVALRAVEARVRELCDTPRNSKGVRLSGDKLMAHAFSPGGPLSDPEAESGEQVGVMELFKGTFGAVRNVVMHTEREWSDDIEAAEYVLLADLLMRLLDKAEGHVLENQVNALER